MGKVREIVKGLSKWKKISLTIVSIAGTIFGLTVFALKLEIIHIDQLSFTIFDNRKTIKESDPSKLWDVSLVKNAPITNACYTCQILFVPSYQDEIRPPEPFTKGSLLLADIPFPVKVKLKNDIKIKGINIYAIVDGSSKVVSIRPDKADDVGNVTVPVNEEKDILSVSVSKNGKSKFFSKESIYQILDTKESKNELFKAAKSNKIFENFDDYEYVYLGILQYYKRDEIQYTFNVPVEPKISFNIIEFVDTSGKSYFNLLGTKVSYRYPYDHGGEIDDGDNVEYLLLDEVEFTHDETYIKEFIEGKEERKYLTNYIIQEIENENSEAKGLNSAAAYYKDGKVDEQAISKKYDQIIQELEKIKEKK